MASPQVNSGVGHAAVAKHHDEKREAPPGVSERDGAGISPVHLCGFAGREGEAEEGGVAYRAPGTHVGFHDAEAAGVSFVGAQALIDLGGAVGVALQPAGDGGLERIELAGALGAEAAGEGGEVRVFGHRLRADPQFAGDLVETQAALLMEQADLAIGFVVDHFGTSIIARKISPMERTSPLRASGTIAAAAAVLGSRLNT